MTGAQGLFVVGTDTDVGKTVLSAALVLGAKARGIAVRYFKPLASGGEDTPHGLASPDALLLERLGGLCEPARECSLYCLRAPLAPLPAARREGVPLDIDEIVARGQAHIAAPGWWVVEGVGGLLVPVAPRATVLDLAVGLGLPALVVGRAGLGTINHTLLTIEALRRAGVRLLGFVLSTGTAAQGQDLAVADNAALVTEFSGVPHLGTLPFVARLDAPSLCAAADALNWDLLLADRT